MIPLAVDIEWIVEGKGMDADFAAAWVNASPEATIAASSSGRIVGSNGQACRLFHCESGQLAGRHLTDLLADRSRGPLQSALAQHENQPEPWVLRLTALRGNGEFPVELLLSPFQARSAGFFAINAREVPEAMTTEEALRLANRRLRDFIDHAADGIFVADQNARFLDANAAACAMLGVSREELLTRTMMDVTPPDELGRLAATLRQLREPGQTAFTEWELYHRDGTVTPVEVSSRVLVDGTIQAFVRDISRRKRTESALRTAETGLREAQRIAGMGSWDWDLRTNRIERSPEIYRLYGIDPTGDLDPVHSLMQFIPEEDRDIINRCMVEAFKKGGVYSIEHRVIRPDGEERILRQRGEVILENERAVKVIGTALDITAQKKVEREKEAALRQLRAVLDACPVGIMIAETPQLELARVNGRARELGGEGSTLLKPGGEPLPPEESPLARALRGERTLPEEFLLRRSNGTDIPIRGSAVPVPDPSGRVVSAVAVFDDVSMEKELERLRTEWIAVVAHDLRQPLAILGLYSDIVCRLATQSDRDIVGASERIKRTIRRMDRMIRDLLDFGQLEAGRVTLDKDPIDLVAVVREACSEAEVRVNGRPIRIHNSHEQALVLGDRDRLTQILENLLSNAIKYGADHSPVDVEVAQGEAGVSVSVSNVGPGLTEAEADHLFQRFRRTDGARRQGVRGIGLGLAIVRALVVAHGGEIDVRSTPGQVTTFRFTLPAAVVEHRLSV